MSKSSHVIVIWHLRREIRSNISSLAVRYDLVVWTQEELLRVKVEVRRQAVCAVVIIVSIIKIGLTIATVLLVLSMRSSCHRATGRSTAQPRKGVWVFHHDSGEKVREAVRPFAGGSRLANEFEHEVRPETEASKVTSRPRWPTGHRDAVDHVGRHVPAQLPLHGALTQLVLVRGLSLDGFQRLVEIREIEEGPFCWFFLLLLFRPRRMPILCNELPVGSVHQRNKTLSILISRKLRPTLIKVRELMGAAAFATELVEELIK
mmetsp:Transcript_31882/g.85239  ORF Transcript_31882/g.85239 Transcript_31882/m.85239 type:complete len:262 (-) Transcript_31882:1120-1905(-)